jgi:hypothetical protein
MFQGRLPSGLAWQERSGLGAWRGIAQVQFSGRQALRMIGLLVVAALCLIFGNYSGNALVVCACAAAGAVFAALRRPKAVRFEIGTLGFVVDAGAPISLANIQAFELLHEENALWGTHANHLLVRFRNGRSEVLKVLPCDPVYIRFVAARLSAALATHAEPYRG